MSASDAPDQESVLFSQLRISQQRGTLPSLDTSQSLAESGGSWAAEEAEWQACPERQQWAGEEAHRAAFIDYTARDLQLGLLAAEEEISSEKLMKAVTYIPMLTLPPVDLDPRVNARFVLSQPRRWVHCEGVANAASACLQQQQDRQQDLEQQEQEDVVEESVLEIDTLRSVSPTTYRSASENSLKPLRPAPCLGPGVCVSGYNLYTIGGVIWIAGYLNRPAAVMANDLLHLNLRTMVWTNLEAESVPKFRAPEICGLDLDALTATMRTSRLELSVVERRPFMCLRGEEDILVAVRQENGGASEARFMIFEMATRKWHVVLNPSVSSNPETSPAPFVLSWDDAHVLYDQQSSAQDTTLLFLGPYECRTVVISRDPTSGRFIGRILSRTRIDATNSPNLVALRKDIDKWKLASVILEGGTAMVLHQHEERTGIVMIRVQTDHAVLSAEDFFASGDVPPALISQNAVSVSPDAIAFFGGRLANKSRYCSDSYILAIRSRVWKRLDGTLHTSRHPPSLGNCGTVFVGNCLVAFAGGHPHSSVSNTLEVLEFEPDSRNALGSALRRILDRKALSDFQIVLPKGSERREIHAHKFILAARSAWFRKWLSTHPEETIFDVESEFNRDFSADYFYDVIAYIYSGELGPSAVSSSGAVTAEVATLIDALGLTCSSDSRKAVLSVGRDLAMAYEHSAWQDLRLVTTDGVVSVHGAVLAARSDYFFAMLVGDRFSEAQRGSVNLKGKDLDVVKLFCHWCYADDLQQAAEPDVALEMLPIAVEFSALSLVSQLSNVIADALDVDTAPYVLFLAERLFATQLVRAAASFCYEHRSRVVEGESFNEYGPQCEELKEWFSEKR